MVHSDNKGLVLPPRVAPTQVVVIPIHFRESAEEAAALDNKANEITNQLKVCPSLCLLIFFCSALPAFSLLLLLR